MSYNPAKVIRSDRGSLAEGKPADIVIFDPNREYTFLKEDIVSKSKNTPFIGRTLQGMVLTTIVDGKIVYQK